MRIGKQFVRKQDGCFVCEAGCDMTMGKDKIYIRIKYKDGYAGYFCSWKCANATPEHNKKLLLVK